MKYDGRLKTYVISSEELNNYSVDYLNKFSHKLLIEYPSTKDLSISFLNSINNPRVGFKIIGGCDKERTVHWNDENKKNPHNRPGRFGIEGVSYFDDCNIYAKSDMVKILKKIEEIESGIMPQWSDIKKALYIYSRLREDIIYHPKYEQQEARDIKSLRGLFTGKSVCMGYALIYKEFMDRLGIKCDFVQGNTVPNASDFESSHCWNLLHINGNIFPIDLTWDATKYRQGQSDSFDFFSNVELFRKTHFPCSIEKIRDYSVLKGIKSDFVKKTINQFKRKKDFSNSIINLLGDNGEDIKLVQTNVIQKNNDEPLYRYVMATKGKDGIFRNYRIVFSEANFLKVYNEFLKGKFTNDSVAIKAHYRLFSYSNVDKYLNEGTSYIGNVVRDKNSSSGYKFVYNSSKKNSNPVTYKELIRNNGEHFVINESLTSKVLGYDLHFGSISSFSDKEFRGYKIVSDNSLLDDNSHDYINDFLDEDRLDRKVRQAGGYLGYYKDGTRCYRPELNAYFNISSSGDITADDIVSSNISFNNNNNKLGVHSNDADNDELFVMFNDDSGEKIAVNGENVSKKS